MKTRKAIKVIGTEQYINKRTGQLEEMQVITIEERDANFHKVWLWHIASALEIIGNQKIKVLCYIAENINKENQFIGTQRKIAKDLEISLNTVMVTMKLLQEVDFLTMQQNGVYQVNPDVIFKGGKSDRLQVLIQYTKTRDEQKIGNEEEVE